LRQANGRLTADLRLEAAGRERCFAVAASVTQALRNPGAGCQTLFLCQMRDFPADPQRRPPDDDLRASGRSYAHKGMHMTWMPKARNSRQKREKPH
jgi:hypothetical protein